MKKLVVLMCLMLVVSCASADTFRFMGNGNWEDSQWQNQTLGQNNVAPPGTGDTARMNWGGATCTLNSEQTVTTLNTGVDEDGTLVIANGGLLHTTSWSSIGNNGATTGSMEVLTGGVADFGQHLWVGKDSPSVGVIDINGGTVSVAAMLGLGWNGGVGYMNVNDGGVLDLFQLHGDGISSMKNGSILDITGTGQVLLPGNYTSVVNAYIGNGTIFGNGVLGNIDITVTGTPGLDEITTLTAVPEPASMLLLGLGGLLIRRKK